MPRCILAALVALLSLSAAHAQEKTDPSAEVETTRARLVKLGEPQTEDGKLWKAAIEVRIALLEELIRTAEESAALTLLTDIDQRQETATKELAAERASPEPDRVALRSPKDLEKHKEERRVAQAARDKASAVSSASSEKRDQVAKERKALPARDTAAKRALADLTGEDELTLYLRENAKLATRVAAARRHYLERTAKLLAGLIPLQQRELDLAELRLTRKKRALEIAREEAARLRAADAEREQETSRAEEEAAEREADPIIRFRRTCAAEAADARSRAQSAASAADACDARIHELKAEIDRIWDEREHMEKRLEFKDPALSEMLGQAYHRASQRGRTLTHAVRPDLARESARAQGQLNELLDRIWALRLPTDESPVLADLLGDLPGWRADEAVAAYREATQGANGLLDVLRGSRLALVNLVARQGELEATLAEFEWELRRHMEFCEAELLFSRSDVPLSPGVFIGAGREVPVLFDTYVDSTLWREGLARVKHATRGAMLLLILSVLAITFVVVPRILRRSRTPGSSDADGEAPWPGGLLAFLSLLRSVSPPAGLYLAGRFIETLGLPPAFGQALPRVLFILAAFLLLRRMADWFLRPGGVGRHGLGFTSENAARLLRTMRILTTAGMALAAPAGGLGLLPGLHHLPRLLETLWILALAFCLILLVARRGPVIRQFARPGGTLDRLWLVVGPLLSLGLAGLALLELAGYRVASRTLFAKVSELLLIVLGISILYAVLIRVMAEESSREVSDQLTRLTAIAIVAVTVLLILRSWDERWLVLQYLSEIRLAEIEPGEWLNLLQVLHALLVVAAGHFVVANLSAVYGALVFPLLGHTNRGGRYVALALSRYAVLLIAYSSAVLMIGFHFSSLAWLFAAASVGIGFGLQEIIANFVSGLIILIERPIQVGDIVSVDDVEGTVEKITIRATIVTNWDRQAIVIPNKDFITKKLTNWTRNDDVMRRRIDIQVGFGSDLEKVLASLEDTIASHPAVLDDPPHRIWLTSFEDSGLGIVIYFFTRISDGLATRAELHRHVYERLEKEGIEIPYPKREIFVMHEPEEAPPTDLPE